VKLTLPRAARTAAFASAILVGLASGCLNPRPEDFPSNDGFADSEVDDPAVQSPPDDLGSAPDTGGDPPAGESEPPPDAGAPDAGSEAPPDAAADCSEGAAAD
jgi:hypothetical protein